jgi:hypothetical protein
VRPLDPCCAAPCSSPLLSFLVARERNVFDWIQDALLDYVSEASHIATRREGVALDLRLLRSESGRAAAAFQAELDDARDCLQVTVHPKNVHAIIFVLGV